MTRGEHDAEAAPEGGGEAVQHAGGLGTGLSRWAVT